MRGATAAWVAQAVAFAALTGGMLSVVWLAVAVALAVVAVRVSAVMDDRATLCCVAMAAGTLVWNSVEAWPVSATLLMAGAFLVPLAWRAKVLS